MFSESRGSSIQRDEKHHKADYFLQDIFESALGRSLFRFKGPVLSAPVISKKVVYSWDDQRASIELNIANVINDALGYCSEGIYRCKVDYIDIYGNEHFFLGARLHGCSW